MDHTKLSHSVSLSENSSRFDQNQNDDTTQFKENSPHSGNRLTKSASWFNSLSRRASRKTPIKKRSFAFGSNLENLSGTGVARPRLNKSDWDVRKTPEQSTGMSLTPEVSSSSTNPPTSRSTDCLDLDAACAGMRHCISDVTDAHIAPKLQCECQPVRAVRHHREK